MKTPQLTIAKYKGNSNAILVQQPKYSTAQTQTGISYKNVDYGEEDTLNRINVFVHQRNTLIKEFHINKD